MFFAIVAGASPLVPERVVLNDLNQRLMTTFEVVRDSPARLIKRLGTLAEEYLKADETGRKDYYYEIREWKPTTSIGVAAKFIFLNKTCYNGLYRENRKGKFNVPHGRYAAPNIDDADAIEAASEALSGVRLDQGDFERSCESAEAGDFVYFDPPFHPLSRTSNFTTYTSRDFTRADQERLAAVVRKLTDRGVRVMVSNSAHEWIRTLYSDDARYEIELLPSRRMINSRGDRRGVIDELLMTNYPSPATS